MNYSTILLNGYRSSDNWIDFERYIIKNSRIAERDEFITPEEFFEKCLDVIEYYEQYLNKDLGDGKTISERFINFYNDPHLLGRYRFKWYSKDVKEIKNALKKARHLVCGAEANGGMKEDADIDKPSPPPSNDQEKKKSLESLSKLLCFSRTKENKDKLHAYIDKIEEIKKDFDIDIKSNKDYAAIYLIVFQSGIFKPAATYSEIRRLFDSIFNTKTIEYKPNKLKDVIEKLKNNYEIIDNM